MSFHQTPTVYVETVHLKVKDLAKSLAFYQEIIGLRVGKQTDRTVHLTANGQNILVILEEGDNTTPRNQRETGLFHLALLLPHRADLGRFLHHLMQKGFPFGAGDHHVSEALYLTDPDGNGIEIYIDRDPNKWRWYKGMVYMTTENIDTNSLLEAGKKEPWNGLPKETVMGHIHLQVNELVATEHFYTTGLGFKVVCDYGGTALFLSTGDYHHHIAVNVWASKNGNEPSPQSVGLQSYAIVYPTKEERTQAVERLRALGDMVEAVEDDFTVKDPAGNQVRLKVNSEE